MKYRDLSLASAFSRYLANGGNLHDDGGWIPVSQLSIDPSTGNSRNLSTGRYDQVLELPEMEVVGDRNKHVANILQTPLTVDQARQRHANIAEAYFNEAPTLSNLYHGVDNWLRSKGILQEEGTGLMTGMAPTPDKIGGISSAQLLYKLQRGKITKAELSKLVSEREADWAIKNVNNREQVNKLNAILDKAAKGMKGKRGANTDIIRAENSIKARTPEGRLQMIRDKYMPQISKSADSTGIDWSDQNSVMASMPDELKLSPVGFDENTPFLERYYDNVMKVIGKDGIQNQLLNSGELRRNADNLWEGKFEDGYRLVEPTEYIKMRIANNKNNGINLSLDARKPGATNYPMHGTMTKDYRYLTMPSSNPGKSGYWTAIQDQQGIKSGMLDYYKGKGASVPFFRMPDYEGPLMKSNGISSSNSYGGTGQSLMNMLLTNPGKIQRPTFVSDPRGTGIPVNEYNFGPNVPNPKSMWNTLDFEPGAGPFAYNQNSEDTILTV